MMLMLKPRTRQIEQLRLELQQALTKVAQLLDKNHDILQNAIQLNGEINELVRSQSPSMEKMNGHESI